MVEFGKTVDGLKTLFNSFQKIESKDKAIHDVWSKFQSVIPGFDVDAFQSNDFKFGKLAGDIAKTFSKNVAVSGGLTAAGMTEGISVIPALIDSVVEGVIGLFKKDAPSNEQFFPGEWVSVQKGFIKDTSADIAWRDSMWEDADDGNQIEIPNYNVGFFINYTRDGTRALVFDCREGDVSKEISVDDIRSIPDQNTLDQNEFLRDLKLLYFKKEGATALAKTKDEVAVGKNVKFEDAIWDILEFEPIKKVVHLVKDNKVVQTTLDTIKSFDAQNQLTWLTDLGTESFPESLVKYNYCWVRGETFEDLGLVTRIDSRQVAVRLCKDGKTQILPEIACHHISDKFAELIVDLPEFRRFQRQVIQKVPTTPIWRYRHLIQQSLVDREVDKVDRDATKSKLQIERATYKVDDLDLSEKVKEMELAYNEKFEVMADEEGYDVRPVNKF